jgi:hypothetical protein
MASRISAVNVQKWVIHQQDDQAARRVLAEDRAFVEFVQRMRSQPPPQPPREPQPMNWEEINAILAELPPYEETEDLGFPFGFGYKNNGAR